MEGTGEAAPFFLFCTDLFLKNESRNITDISFFMMVFVLYDALSFIFSSCLAVSFPCSGLKMFPNNPMIFHLSFLLLLQSFLH